MEVRLGDTGRNEWTAWSPSRAAEFLREEQITLRTFAEALAEMYPGADLADRLVQEFTSLPQDPDLESVQRKVRSWLSGKHAPSSREDLFRIGFALNLREGEVSRLLGQCTGCGIHYREGRDVIYAWFLRAGLPYTQALEFFEALPPVPHPQEPLPAGMGTSVTHELKKAFRLVQDQETLRKLYCANLERFGALHLRAYSYFDRYLQQLRQPSGPEGADSSESSYSLEEITELYLTMRMPRQRLRTGMSITQKMIRRSWPNATLLKNICSRKEDVPRKLLLLLYLVTENVVDPGYTELDEAYISPAEHLEQHWITLNAILSDCGMPELDPRDPTDWLTLYALGSEKESMSDRMAGVIQELFSQP